MSGASLGVVAAEHIHIARTDGTRPNRRRRGVPDRTGHDVWVVGDEEFGADEFYTATAAMAESSRSTRLTTEIAELKYRRPRTHDGCRRRCSNIVTPCARRVA